MKDFDVFEMADDIIEGELSLEGIALKYGVTLRLVQEIYDEMIEIESLQRHSVVFDEPTHS